VNELASEGLETPAAAPLVADTRTTVADDTAEAGSVEQLKAARLAAKCFRPSWIGARVPTRLRRRYMENRARSL
jgi:hypothetical protein